MYNILLDSICVALIFRTTFQMQWKYTHYCWVIEYWAVVINYFVKTWVCKVFCLCGMYIYHTYIKHCTLNYNNGTFIYTLLFVLYLNNSVSTCRYTCCYSFWKKAISNLFNTWQQYDVILNIKLAEKGNCTYTFRKIKAESLMMLKVTEGVCYM